MTTPAIGICGCCGAMNVDLTERAVSDRKIAICAYCDQHAVVNTSSEAQVVSRLFNELERRIVNKVADQATHMMSSKGHPPHKEGGHRA